jgi:hypothetical protein
MENRQKTQEEKVVEVPTSPAKFLLFILMEIRAQKRWLLLPIWILLAAVAILLFVMGTNTLLPAIYTFL